MNRILALILICLGVSLSTMGQEMTVKSFRKLDNDLTAKRQGTSRVDFNGRTAALIRVITPGKGYAFDGGSLGIVGNVEYHSGEIWVYVPERAQKLSISHEKYGVLRDYYYSEPIEGGSTYEMLLDPGVGRFCNITASQTGVPVYVDGDSIGVAPIDNYYMLYGQHYIKAQENRMIGEVNFNMTKDSETNIRLELEDMSKYYVQVSIRVDDNAEIWYNEEKKGVGVWNTELYKGEYVIQSRKDGCESRFTRINIDPETSDNQLIQITAPVPYQGYLRLTVTPHDANITSPDISTTGVSRVRKITENAQTQLNAGLIRVNFERKGYYSEEREYEIMRNSQTVDTVKMRRISYVKKNQFYFGAGYTAHTFMGVSAIVGFTAYHVDVQASYTLGLTSSDNLSWYQNNEYNSTMNYKQNVMSAKIGYQIVPTSRIALVPQLGYSLLQLVGTQVEGAGKLGDGAKCSCFTIGAKIEFVPSQNVSFFVMPEYAIASKKDKYYELIADRLKFTAGGFYATGGLIIKS